MSIKLDSIEKAPGEVGVRIFLGVALCFAVFLAANSSAQTILPPPDLGTIPLDHDRFLQFPESDRTDTDASATAYYEAVDPGGSRATLDGWKSENGFIEPLPATTAGLTAIGAWEMKLFAGLLAAMKAVPEGEGTLLDNSMVVFLSECSDGDTHSHEDLPVLVAGRAGGEWESGRLIETGGRPLAGLHLSALKFAGAPDTTFGMDGTCALLHETIVEGH